MLNKCLLKKFAGKEVILIISGPLLPRLWASAYSPGFSPLQISLAPNKFCAADQENAENSMLVSYAAGTKRLLESRDV